MHHRHTFFPEAGMDVPDEARRRFLGYIGPLLAASPGGTSIAAAVLSAASGTASAQSYDTLRAATKAVGDVIASPDEALNVMDFEPAARKALPPAHFGYLATGVDDDATLRANHEDYARLRINPRRLIDARKIDTSVTVLGTKWPSPIFLAPVSSQGAFHSDAEIAVAKAARAKGHQLILSTVGNSSVESVTQAYGAPIWYMLYPTDDWTVTEALVRRAERAGCQVLVLTVDRQGGRNTETLFRLRRLDDRQCIACHQGGFKNEVARKPMFDGLDVSRVTNLYGTGMNWDFVARLRASTKMKIVLKGIMTAQDAKAAVQHGVDGIIVSNHGGRAEESLQSTIGALPAVVAAVRARVPVLVDGGVRRGTDVLKALALGATAVGIGRPYCWGLAAFGQPGVEAVLSLLDAEFATIMRQVGATTVAGITRQAVS